MKAEAGEVSIRESHDDCAPAAARCFVLGTTSLSELGYEHGNDEPVIRAWNQFAGARE